MHLLESLAITYLSEIRNQRAQLHSTDELSYRDFLGKFLRGAANALAKTAQFTGEAQRITFGRPDYEVTNGLRVIGYVEAEALGTPLSQLKGSAKEQNERFRANLYNFLLTNHIEFRLYLDGNEIATAKLPDPPESGAITISASALDELQALLETFLDASTPAAATPEEIAKQLARRARLLRVAADAMLSHEDSPLHPYWNLYRQTLFDGIDREKFADVYAQTFTYGLFLAWLNTTGMLFDRPTALHALPRTVPPIRVLLQFGGGDELPEPFHWIVDGICSDLEAADRTAATKRNTAIDDPLIHFYEPFLAAYDPKLRKRAGVYYTPDPVVDFIIRAVDDLLKRDFGKPEEPEELAEGLADSNVRLLDPATGTATFLARAYRQVYETMHRPQSGDAGLWPDRARNHLAKHFYGFERLPAAYTLAHLKLRQLLTELNAPLPDSERLPVYLADTMMNKAPEQINLPGADVLSREIREAARVRDQEEILVVVGNPPYNRKTENPSRDAHDVLTFIGKLIQDYYTVDGKPLDEKNPQNLQNDYVKFLRFAQWRIERSGKGIVAFITDNSYLDNVTFKGMRRSLMRTFDEIYLLDLHGNSEKREHAPDGGIDKNVFDIKQGVAIVLCLRRAHRDADSPDAVIRHADLYGSRIHKYTTLQNFTLQSLSWQTLAPDSPSYWFMPQDQRFRQEYYDENHTWSINTAFLNRNWGIVTRKDYLLIAYDSETLRERFEDIRRLSAEEATHKYNIVQGVAWVRSAQKHLKGDLYKDVRPILYRPFDIRYILYRKELIERGDHRYNLMQHLLRPNLSLITTRITKEPFSALVFRGLSEHKASVRYDGTFVFPLWLYPADGTLEEGEERRPNLNPAFVEAIAKRVNTLPAPEDIFFYTYAIFHAPAYRERYAPFLKTDFPRLPLPSDADSFLALVALGAQLVALHLLESPKLQPTGIAFPISGDHHLEKRKAAKRYLPPTSDGKPGRVYLNPTEYFDNVPTDVWEFHVNGYQPAFEWLDDRAGRRLTEAEITHYRRMLAAMRETAALLPQVDVAFRQMMRL